MIRLGERVYHWPRHVKSETHQHVEGQPNPKPLHRGIVAVGTVGKVIQVQQSVLYPFQWVPETSHPPVVGMVTLPPSCGLHIARVSVRAVV